MPRAARPRRRYRPRPVEADPVGAAIARAALVPAQGRAPLLQALQAALDGLRTATGGWPAWCAMADSLNVAERLAVAGIASNCMPQVQAGQAALQTLHDRHAASGRWTLRADELRALDEAAFIHRVQLQHCTQGELVKAIAEVQQRTTAALAGNAPRGTRMCVGELGQRTEAAS